MLELNKIYHMDCLEGLRLLDDNSIDVIITSPPYNKAGYEGFIRKRHGKDSWNKRNIDYGNDETLDFMNEQEYQKWQIEILNECHRVLKDDGSLFYNHKIRIAKHKASHPIEWLLKSDLVFRQQIVWDRGNSPTLSPIRYVPTTELIFWMTKTRKQPNFKRQKDSPYLTEVWRISPSRDTNHPASYPIELVDNILHNIDNKNGEAIVLDPFSGIGKTALSAKNHGFQYVGFEKVENYVTHSISVLSQDNLFEPIKL